ncbi:hypothetical protein CFIICLFH_4218 [Methylobacterium goesingense]|nr:hypothetical protein CFIICLFH_4218 [Methylobacterium goesingense]
MNPPASEATTPEATNQTPALSDSVEAAGLSAATGPTLDRPTPTPTMFRITCVTSAVTAPAKIAPHETWFRSTVRVSAEAAAEGVARMGEVDT